jgi:type IV secretory pathway VirB10-like protein
MNRVLLFCVLLLTAMPYARGDDVWHNIYHSLKRFFTGEKHHSGVARRHRLASHSHTQPADTPHEESAEPRVIVLPGPTPEQNVDTTKPAEAKPADAKPEDRKPDKSPKSTPTPAPTPTPTSAPTPNSSPVLRSIG